MANAQNEASHRYKVGDDGTLRSGLSRLVGDRTLCDVDLQAENKTFPAHKVVLAAMSSYFEAMFTRGFTESQRDNIVLEVRWRQSHEKCRNLYSQRNPEPKYRPAPKVHDRNSNWHQIPALMLCTNMLVALRCQNTCNLLTCQTQKPKVK